MLTCTSTHCERRQECASPNECTGSAKDWIKHDGGECPVAHDAEVFVRYRDGIETEIRNQAALHRWKRLAHRVGCAGDIVAYRFAKAEASK